MSVDLTRDSSNAKDITDLSFFNVSSRFIRHEYTDNGVLPIPSSTDVNGSDVNISNLDKFDIYPNIWIYTDSLAKSMYSTVMTDLGQSGLPNILLDEVALQHYTINFTGLRNPVVNLYVGPALDSFSTLKNQVGPLGTSTSVIFAKYLCQVPKRKSTGSLIVSILVADLIFLQAVWKLFTFTVGNILGHKDVTGQFSPF